MTAAARRGPQLSPFSESDSAEPPPPQTGLRRTGLYLDLRLHVLLPFAVGMRARMKGKRGTIRWDVCCCPKAVEGRWKPITH